MKKIIIGVMIVISFVFVLKISCVQAQNIMGDETSQEENCEQLNWTLENGILIIYGQGKIPMDFFEDNSIDPDPVSYTHLIIYGYMLVYTNF